jgi:hypothetical protein
MARATLSNSNPTTSKKRTEEEPTYPHDAAPAVHLPGAPIHTSPGEFLKRTLGASTIITAWLFVVGWAYLHTYFAYFGINIASLDFSIYTYFAEDFAQLVSNNAHGVLFGLLILCMFTLIWFGDRVIHKIAGLAIGVAVLLLFWIGFQLARTNAFRAAQRDIELRTSALPLVNAEFSDHHDFVDGDISVFLESSDLRLLWETKDTLFVFVPVNTAQPQVFVRVLALDRSKILASLRSERIK